MRTGSEPLAEALVVFAEMLAEAVDAPDLLHELTVRCVDLVDADAAGLVMADAHGALHVMASSTGSAAFLELFQLERDEGPCVECCRSGDPVAEEDLEQAGGRWPLFGPMAVRAGFRSVHTLPMRSGTRAVGALNLFARRPGTLPKEDLRLAQAFADLATVSVLQSRRVHEQEVLAGQLQRALDSRVVIERATGVIAGRTGLDVDAAFDRLRRAARRTRRPLSEVADDVVQGRLDAGSQE